jgi:putative transposase
MIVDTIDICVNIVKDLVYMKPRAKQGSYYKLTYHLVLTTKYRKKVMSPEVLTFISRKATELLNAWDCSVMEINGEADHLHILFEAHPALKLCDLVNNLKTVTSRYTRKEFLEHIKKFYWGTDSFWNGSYCILSTGGVTIDVIKKYIENQGKEEEKRETDLEPKEIVNQS